MLRRGDGLGKAGAKLGLLALTASQELVTLQGDLLGPWLPGVLVCPPRLGCGSCPSIPAPAASPPKAPLADFPIRL